MSFKKLYKDALDRFETLGESKTDGEPEELTMDDWYDTRTNDHISNVRHFMEFLKDDYPEFEERMENHDKSKFEDPEVDPYKWVTWKYKCADEGWDFDSFDPPEDILDIMNTATHHHVTTNSHHPEFHSPDQEDILNRDDRDKQPDKLVDATTMPEIDMAEMCCDWCGMSKERGGDPRDWAKSNINVRWKFSKDQEEFIYNTLDRLWEVE